MNEIKLFHIFLDIGYYIGKYLRLKEKKYDKTGI